MRKFTALSAGMLFAPVAGALVDRWNRRTILMVSDALNAVTVLALALLSMAGVLRLWHVFVVIGVGSLLRAIQMPALNSVVVLLAPKEHVGRANGMVLLAQAIGNTVGFAAGGVLLVAIGLDRVLLIDCATFVLNVAILLFVAIPAPPRSAAGSADAGRLLGEIRQGWRYLSTRRVLVALIAFYAALQFTVGYVDALFTPLVLSFASAKALGLVVAFTGVGMLLGSVLLTTWGGPRRRIHGLAGFALPLGLFLFLGALRPSVPLIIVAALSFTLCFTVIDGTTRSVLQLEIEPDMQGRAFATFNMVTNAVLCASYALAGPIADHWFEPLLRAGGPLADTVGAVIGVGPGRGVALLVLMFGDSESFGGSRLRAALAYRWTDGDVEPVMVTHGSSEAIYLVMHLALEPGDEVVVLDPAYQQLYDIAAWRGCRITRWPLLAGDGFRADLPRLRELARARPRMIVANFPHNPTGVSITRAEQDELVAIAAECGAWLVWDNAFGEITYTGDPLPLPRRYDRCICFGTLSKSYGLAGLRVGWCLAPPDLLARMAVLRDYIALYVSPVLEFFAELAVRNADRIV